MYCIKKMSNGNVTSLHKAIPTYDDAYDMLICMHSHETSLKNKAKLLRWSLSINDNEVIYLISNDTVEGK